MSLELISFQFFNATVDELVFVVFWLNGLRI